MTVSAVQRLTRIRLNSRDPGALAGFFIEALGFARLEAREAGVLLGLGMSRLEIVRAPGDASPYPLDARAWSPLYQHIEIVTADMDRALARLVQAGGWMPISAGGPERLPARSGGGAAFKLRDPDGHALALVEPAAGAAEDAGLFTHIRGAAASVADMPRSIDFYKALGFRVGVRRFNFGAEQDRLDGVARARPALTTLLPADEGGGQIELICYPGKLDRETAALAPGDIADIRPVFSVADADALAAIMAAAGSDATENDDGTSLVVRDPDGHRLQFESRA